MKQKQRKQKQPRAYLVTWHGQPMYWSERWSRFYAGAGFGRHPITLMATKRLAEQRVRRAVESWGKNDRQWWQIRTVALAPDTARKR
jgi:hypothetical protein